MRKLTRKTQLTTDGPVFVYVDEAGNKIVRIRPSGLADENVVSWEI